MKSCVCPHSGHVTVSFRSIDIVNSSLQCEAACFLAVDGKGEQRTLVDCCEVTGALELIFVVLADQFQRFLQLQHSCEFVLAVVAAEAGADETADLAVAVFELDLVCFTAFDDGVALGAVDADIPKGLLL